jgi:2-formylbenzoate dehydrogenase
MTLLEDARTAIDRPWEVQLGGRPMPTRARYDIEDPTTGRRLTDAPDCSPAEVDRIVRAAAEAQRAWAKLPARARAAKVREFAALLRAYELELATIDAIDAGFPLPVMRADVGAAATLLDIMADHALQLGGHTYPLSGNLHYSLQEPYGVVGRIIPFNHPLFFAAGKIAAPLVAGNAVVLKTPDQTPLSGLRMAELAAGVFGPDLCAVISGRGAASGAALVAHPLIRRIGFIGAPDTGRLIQRQAAEHGVKYISLELGGKNALIVLPDANLDKAINSAVFGMNYTATAGQSCGSTSRLLLHESVADEVLDAVVERVRAIRVGHPLAEGTQMGPVISRNQYDKSINAITAATAAGGQALAGGGRPDTVGPRRVVRRAHRPGRHGPGQSRRRRRDLRAGAVGADLPRRGGSGRDRQSQRLRPDRRRLHQRRDSSAPCRGRVAGRLRLDQRQFPPLLGTAFRRRQSLRRRARGVGRRTALLHGDQSRDRGHGMSRPPPRHRQSGWLRSSVNSSGTRAALAWIIHGWDVRAADCPGIQH